MSLFSPLAVLNMLKPSWLNKKIKPNCGRKIKILLRDLKLNTVCQQAFCPNISECFSSGTATFMILGSICTRACSFCAVKGGRPCQIDWDEPRRIKQAVKRLNLGYVVITSPTRDDLADGGAKMFSQTVKGILSLNPKRSVEVLIPDFSGNQDSIEKVTSCGAKVVAHNLETVPSLYIKVRPQADYQRSLRVLKEIKAVNNRVFTKSSLMLGLGETEQEVREVLADLRKINCDFLTLGQYLSPSLNHYPLKEYIHPDKFAYFRQYAIKIGFKAVKSSPYTRSSYLAHSLRLA